MMPDEWKSFIDTGIPPAKRTYCVVCWCGMTLDTVLAFRGNEVLIEEQDEETGEVKRMEQEFILDKNELLQPFDVTTDNEEGYYRECVLQPLEKNWEGMQGPMPIFRTTAVVGRLTKEGQPFLDQSAMVWKQGVPEQIQMGESVRNFSTGVRH